MNKPFLIGATLMIVGVLASFAACNSASTAISYRPMDKTGFYISELAISAEIDSNKKAVNPKTIFGRDVPELHCSFKISNAPANTQIISTWIMEKDVDKAPVNKTIYNLDVTGEGNRYLDVYMIKPNQGWTLGEYKVILTVGGMEYASIQYSVKAGEPAYKPSYAIAGVMASSVDKNGLPVDRKNTFTPKTERIYCVVHTVNLPDDSEVRVLWVYTAGEQPGLIGSVVTDISATVGGGTRYLPFYYDKPLIDWPRGDYVVKIYLNGTEKSYVPFIVR